MPFISTVALLRECHARTSPFEVFKYVCRGLMTLHAHREWARFLGRDEAGRSLAQRQPHLLWKLQRAYLSRRATLTEKLAWLREHHSWIAGNWPEHWRIGLYCGDGVELSRVESGGVIYRWHLAIEAQFAKEGELVLQLWCDAIDRQNRVATLGFTVHRHHGAWAAHIGCLQGPSAPDGAVLVRMATKELHGQRPLIAAVMALFDFCSASGLAQVIAVAQKDHVYQGRWRCRHRVQRDYDALWIELAGRFDGSAWHFVPHRVRREPSSMPPHKRAMYRRRYAMEDEVSAQVAGALRGPGPTR